MTNTLPVDWIYLAACARDARLTRICVASIRYFYPDVPIRVLPGDILQRGLAKELKKYWNVDVMDIPPGDYGWGFVKLEPLFGPSGERFLVMDVDTVFTGHVLDLRAESDAPFMGDNERLPDADAKRLYYDWDRLRDIDPEVAPARRALNGGQWFGTAGLVTREEFDPWIEWSLPRRQRYPESFMGGEQGVMSCVLLKKEAREGLRIHRRTLMRWPGHSMDGLSAEAVAAMTAPPLVIHWAGMKTRLLRNAVGADVLTFFERHYYSRFPLSGLRQMLANGYHLWLQWKHFFAVRLRLGLRRWVARLSPAGTHGDPKFSP